MSEIEIPALHLPEHIVAKCVPEGQTYEDDPTKPIPSGWWVLGYDDPSEPYLQIHIGEVVDANDNDISRTVAALVAEVLEEASVKGSE